MLDKLTGKIYYATSGDNEFQNENGEIIIDARPKINEIHPFLKIRMEEIANKLEASKGSLENWPVTNCADFKVLNKVLQADPSAQDRLADLEIHTINTKDGTNKPRCENCKITTAGATVTSDEIED